MIKIKSIKHHPRKRGLGDVIAAGATPIARALRLPCIDPETKQLRQDSGCNQRVVYLNDKVPDVLKPFSGDKS